MVEAEVVATADAAPKRVLQLVAKPAIGADDQHRRGRRGGTDSGRRVEEAERVAVGLEVRVLVAGHAVRGEDAVHPRAQGRDERVAERQPARRLVPHQVQHRAREDAVPQVVELQRRAEPVARAQHAARPGVCRRVRQRHQRQVARRRAPRLRPREHVRPAGVQQERPVEPALVRQVLQQVHRHPRAVVAQEREPVPGADQQVASVRRREPVPREEEQEYVPGPEPGRPPFDRLEQFVRLRVGQHGRVKAVPRERPRQDGRVRHGVAEVPEGGVGIPVDAHEQRVSFHGGDHTISKRVRKGARSAWIGLPPRSARRFRAPGYRNASPADLLFLSSLSSSRWLCRIIRCNPASGTSA